MKILSIIVPVYNKENLMKQCLDSLNVKELSEELEVLLIDDGSGDSSLQIMKEYEKKSPTIFKVFSQENQGVGAVMNLGFHNATGKYIKEVDADDWVDSKSLTALVKYLSNTDIDIVVNPFWSVDDETEKIKPFYYRNIRYQFPYLIEDVLKKVGFSVQGCTIRKSILEERGFELSKQRYYIDMELIESAVMYAKTCVFLRDSLYRYRLGQSEQSVNINSYIKHIGCFREETILSLRRIETAEKNKFSSEKIEYQKRQALTYCVYLYGITALSDNDSLLELDQLIREESPLIYKELEKYHLITRYRNCGPEEENIYKQWVREEYSNAVKKHNGIADLQLFFQLGNTSDNISLSQNNIAREQMRILNQWMSNIEQGRSLEYIFLSKGYKRIAIYGMGMLGEHIYYQLKGSKVQVVYGIDQKMRSVPGLSEKKLIIKKPDENLEPVDAVVITVMQEHETIEKKLKSKISGDIVMVSDLVFS